MAKVLSAWDWAGCGDIVIECDGMRIYLPITTSLIISVVLSLALWLFNR